jgi:hypothetical protein
VYKGSRSTHIDLNVEVLEVERVLPDINANDRNMREERVLISRGSNLKTLSVGVKSLQQKTACKY